MYNSFGYYLKNGLNFLKKEPVLFVPKLISIIFTFGLILISFFTLKIDFLEKSNHLIAPTSSNIIFVIFIIILYILGDMIINSGQLYMIKKVILGKKVLFQDFWMGAKEYAGRIFLGELIIFFIWAIVLLFILTFFYFYRKQVFLNMIMSHTNPSHSLIGFIVVSSILFMIPLLIFSIFISFWSTILVYEDCKVSNAFKLSMRFVKNNFSIAFVLYLLQHLLTRNKTQSNKKGNKDISLQFDSSLQFIKDNPVFLGTFSIVSFLAIIIKSILMLYFEIIYFDIYHDRRSCLFSEPITEE